MTFDEMLAELEALKARTAALEGQKAPPTPPAKPHEKINYLDRLSMPQEAIAEMARAVPDSVVRDLVRDGRNPTALPSIPSEASALPRLAEPRPLEAVPHIELADRIVERFLPSHKAR